MLVVAVVAVVAQCTIIIIIIIIQWNLSTMDTLRIENQVAIWRFPLFTGYFYMLGDIYLDPQKKSVIYRSRSTFSLFGEFVIKGSTMYCII